MNCTICGQPIQLRPSAAERAAKYGGKPSDYTQLFRQHADCVIKERRKDTLELINRQLPHKP